MDVLLLDDELVNEACPLHADVELGDVMALNAYDRRWLEAIACPEMHEFYATARRAQVALQDETDPRHREYLGRQMQLALNAVDRLRARMCRLIAGEPEPDRGPLLDLWAR